MSQIYSTGKISVSQNNVNFTGSGTGWELAGVTGGICFVQGYASGWPIDVINNDGAGKFALPWPGPNLANANYVIFCETAQSARATAANQRLAELINAIRLSPYASATINKDSLLFGAAAGVLGETPLIAFARSLLAAANGSAARTTLELVKQTSTTDATAGRLMGVGAFGLGTSSLTLSQDVNLDDLPVVTAFYNWGSPAPINAPAGFCEMLYIPRNPGTAIQIAFNSAGNSFIRGRGSGTWEAWRPLGSGRVSNSNGVAIKLQDGTQICLLANVTVSFANTDQLSYNWLFPAAFASSPEFVGLTGVNTGASYIGIHRTSLGHAYAQYNAAQSQLGWVRSYGAPDFVNGNAVQAQRLVAIGRYI